VHPSPAVGRALRPVLAGHPSVRLHDPLSYRAFVRLLAACTLVVTDSGGVQEEAPVFGVPVVVARESTERPEGVRAGCAILAGTDPVAVRRAVETLLDDPAARRRMALAPSPYGDGHAGRRIARRLAADLGAGWVARSARPA
jgi:UDP-N-acetylglucosamine 2-epimerase (non-hydrolysing)